MSGTKRTGENCKKSPFQATSDMATPTGPRDERSHSATPATRISLPLPSPGEGRGEGKPPDATPRTFAVAGVAVGVAVAAFCALFSSACGDQGNRTLPVICPDDAPASCVMPAPGFAADVKPIIDGYCVSACHLPGGQVPTLPLQTYDQISPYSGDIKLQLETCEMPPPDSPALTLAQRQILFGWILCGALAD